jgi:NAD(P)-dependent dehydrogenase (short-subunit alcohol dehydrogenase family)
MMRSALSSSCWPASVRCSSWTLRYLGCRRPLDQPARPRALITGASSGGLAAATARAAAGDLKLVVADAGAAGYARLSDVTADDLDGVCAPGLADPAALDRFEAAERALLADGNRPALAAHYRSAAH